MTGTLIPILRDCVNTLQAAIKQTLCQGQHLVKQCFESCSTLKQLDFVKTKLYWSQFQTPNNAKPEKNNSAPNCSLAGIHYQVSLNYLYIGRMVWHFLFGLELCNRNTWIMCQWLWNRIPLPWKTNFSFPKSQTLHYLLSTPNSCLILLLNFQETVLWCACNVSVIKKSMGALDLRENEQLCCFWHTTQLTHCAQQQTSTILLTIPKSSS